MTTPTSKVSYGLIDGNSGMLRRTSDAVELRRMEAMSEDEDRESTVALMSLKPNFPWTGVAALFSIFLLTVASVGVLVASRGSPIDQWRIRNFNIQPQVWLSVLATIMNAVTVFALSDAATKTFWRTASRGTTLRSMNDLYESHFILGALTNLAHLRINKVAVVSILCALSALRGPLFQRASVVQSNVIQRISGQQNLTVAQVIPPFFRYANDTLSTTGFDVAWDAYLVREPIRISTSYQNCGDTCSGEVNGFGFKINCSTSTLPWDASDNSIVRNLFQDSGQPGASVPSFNSSAYLPGVTFYEHEDELNDEQRKEVEEQKIAAEKKGQFDIANLFKTEPVCGGSLTIRTCSVYPAVVRYAVDFKNDSMSLRNDHYMSTALPVEGSVAFDPVLVEVSPWDFPDNQKVENWGPTLQWVAWHMAEFNTEISIYEGRDGGPFSGADVRFRLAKAMMNGSAREVYCNTTFRDPTPFVINRLREMAFRLAVHAGTVSSTEGPEVVLGPDRDDESLSLTRNWTQTVDLRGQKRIVTFSVSIPYLIAAAAVSLLSVAALAPFYWNWKEVSVPLSFNPLDVANAFDAPLLQPAHQEKSIQDYVRKEHGLQPVRYAPEESKNAGYLLSAKVRSVSTEGQNS